MRNLVRFLAILALATGSAQAGPGEHVAIYGGGFDILQNDDEAVVAGVDYRFRDQFNGLRPTVGLMATTDGGAYLYGGAYWDLPLNTAPFVITPGLAAGAYSNGGGKDMGSAVEFRSTLEVAYEMESGNRIGLGISHISNAGIGSDNPGAETVQVVYSHAMY